MFGKEEVNHTVWEKYVRMEEYDMRDWRNCSDPTHLPAREETPLKGKPPRTQMPRSVMQRLSSRTLEGVSRVRNLRNIATTNALSKVPSTPDKAVRVF